MPVARTIETTHSLGRLSLVRGRAQASGEETSALVTSFRSPDVSRKILASRSTIPGGRLVGDEVAHQLVGHVRGGRGMRGQILQHGAALLDARVLVDLVQDLLRPRLVQAPVEGELAAVLGIVAGR